MASLMLWKIVLNHGVSNDAGGSRCARCSSGLSCCEVISSSVVTFVLPACYTTSFVRRSSPVSGFKIWKPAGRKGLANKSNTHDAGPLFVAYTVLRLLELQKHGSSVPNVVQNICQFVARIHQLQFHVRMAGGVATGNFRQNDVVAQTVEN